MISLAAFVDEWQKLASFGTLSDGIPQIAPMGTPPKFSVADTLLKLQQVQLQAGTQMGKMAEVDDKVTWPRVKQLGKNIAVIAPAAALGTWLGSVAGRQLSRTNMGQTLRAGRWGPMLGAAALAGGAYTVNELLRNAAHQKIREAGDAGRKTPSKATS